MYKIYFDPPEFGSIISDNQMKLIFDYVGTKVPKLVMYDARLEVTPSKSRLVRRFEEPIEVTVSVHVNLFRCWECKIEVGDKYSGNTAPYPIAFSIKMESGYIVTDIVPGIYCVVDHITTIRNGE